MHVIHANPLQIYLKVKQIKKFVMRINMYQEIIDPPADVWPDYEIYLDWLEDQAQEYKEDEEAAKFAFEAQRYERIYGRYL